MTTDEMRQEILECLDALTADQRRHLLDYVRILAHRPPKAPGEAVRRFGGSISREDLAVMKKAIEEACE